MIYIPKKYFDKYVLYVFINILFLWQFLLTKKPVWSPDVTNTIPASHESLYCLGCTLPNSVCVYMLCDASNLPLSKDFCHFKSSIGLMSQPPAIYLQLYHETYFTEVFTLGTYKN